jgi:hypothetical protein
MRGFSLSRAVFAFDPAVTVADRAAQCEPFREIEVGEQSSAKAE